MNKTEKLKDLTSILSVFVLLILTVFLTQQSSYEYIAGLFIIFLLALLMIYIVITTHLNIPSIENHGVTRVSGPERVNLENEAESIPNIENRQNNENNLQSPGLIQTISTVKSNIESTLIISEDNSKNNLEEIKENLQNMLTNLHEKISNSNNEMQLSQFSPEEMMQLVEKIEANMAQNVNQNQDSLNKFQNQMEKITENIANQITQIKTDVSSKLNENDNIIQEKVNKIISNEEKISNSFSIMNEQIKTFNSTLNQKISAFNQEKNSIPPNYTMDKSIAANQPGNINSPINSVQKQTPKSSSDITDSKSSALTEKTFVASPPSPVKTNVNGKNKSQLSKNPKPIPKSESNEKEDKKLEQVNDKIQPNNAIISTTKPNQNPRSDSAPKDDGYIYFEVPDEFDIGGLTIKTHKTKQIRDTIKLHEKIFRQQATIRGKTLDIFVEKSETIKKLFKNKELRIVFADDDDYYYLYYS